MHPTATPRAHGHGRHRPPRPHLPPLLAPLAAVVAVASLSAGPAAAATRSTLTMRDGRPAKIGPLDLTASDGATTELRRAISLFGTPSTTRTVYGGNGCRVAWNPIGLQLEFVDYGGRPQGTTVCSSRVGHVTTGTLTTNRWRTDRRLRIGAHARTINRRYPAATRHGSTWTLDQVNDPSSGDASVPTLTAVVHDRRIAALRISTASID